MMNESAKERIKFAPLRDRVLSAEEAAKIVLNGMHIGTCGTPTAGCPDSFFEALAKRGEQGESFKVDIWSCAPLSQTIDGKLVEAGLLNRRLAHQANPLLAKEANKGKVHYSDMGAAWVPLEVRKGSLGRLDLAVIEAVEVTEEGHVVPTINVGDEATFLRYADNVIIEINMNMPQELSGIHDIYIPEEPPNRKPIPLISVSDRIGVPYIEVAPEKIKGIIISDKEVNAPGRAPIDEMSRAIARNVVNFFDEEERHGRLPENLLPFQTGLGALGGAILSELDGSRFENLEVHSALLDDGVLDLIDSGKIKAADGVGLFFTKEALEKLAKNVERYKERLILRPIDIVNSPEVIRRLGVIALNTAIEVDIYGHVNSSHVGGSRIMTGVAGSIEFSRNGYLSIFMTPSVTKKGAISAIVPMVPHVDHTEHEVNVIVTEQGLADLRGLDPRERAKRIIEECAHPDYKPILWDYFHEAEALGGHEPHILSKAFSFHLRLAETETMKT
jgi:succinyl-CoA:acetate CoA-transferase